MDKFRKMFGVVGTSEFSQGGYNIVDGLEWVEVQEERPTVNHVLQSDLTWALDDMKVWEAEMVVQEQLLPSWMEEHIEFDHNGKTDSPALQALYDTKKAKKAEKPK